RGRLPIVVGGTGQYIRALLEGWQTPRVPPDRQFREELYEEVAQAGPEVLYAKLKRVDPVAATSIDPHNVRRIVRALEVSEITGRPFSEARGKEPSPYRSLVIGLTTATRQEMYDLADARVDGMLEQGWLQEVQRLVGMGYKPGLPSLSSLGYRELALYLQGEFPLDEAVRRIKAAHHRLIRHQFTWFKQTDPHIHWLRIGERCEDRAVALIQELLENSATTPSQGR
ncbi:MAG: tRNA (adenosine(37)-N6)-dimethylallyltransferase MiaA, partial [Chloroflexi bacterium]|nr:tRNA (adenosine(37)-N6)-dimethylallyltransferase MiaA [Chloroflexota bacterium]